MSKPLDVIVEKRRTVHTYSELWHASECVLDVGLMNQEGSSWQFLSSILLTAFTFEAYLNHLGSRTMDRWNDHDRLPTDEKFNLLCREIGATFPLGSGARPLQTITELFKFRNTIAHGRTTELNPPPLKKNVGNYMTAHHELLSAPWERCIKDSSFAIRAREDVALVLANLHEASKDEEALFSSGMSHHSATLVVS
ncbi:hypothetical protein A0O30_23830 [Pseudomonas sp. LLC-1]|uniref:hypothetical protein n=1 Tax=Pseudomonas sp. LLC-1 TaxID=1812180 RepID=UPI000D01FEF5|nr:hypothetical protein [Pseudomonas sp. LLC-1]PRN02236.1 hypothetical protein A0O30_23830 [Pseudomonas sp. LLC-1]